MEQQKNFEATDDNTQNGSRIDFDKINIKNDIMFCTVFQNQEECRELLQRILGIKITELSITKQKEIQNHIFFKGIRLDIYAKDSLGNAYDIEMQLNYSGELALRSRYYHGEMDGYQIRKGVKYNNLKESIVIFICDFDLFEKGSSIYTFETICHEYPELTLQDKRKTIFLNINGTREGLSEELSSLLDYFKTSNPTDEYTRRLEEKVKENRNDDEWRENYMTFEMKLDEKYRQGMEKGRAEGRAEGRTENLTNLVRKKLQKGKSLSVIAEECEEEESVIQEIIDSINAEC